MCARRLKEVPGMLVHACERLCPSNDGRVLRLAAYERESLTEGSRNRPGRRFHEYTI